MAKKRPLYNGVMFLDVAQLTVSYPERARAAVDRVTLGLRAGEMGVLIGPSGCGKTTLLRAVAGLERATAGEIRLAQSVVSSATAHVAPESRRIGMVFQDYALFPHLSEQVLAKFVWPSRWSAVPARMSRLNRAASAWCFKTTPSSLT